MQVSVAEAKAKLTTLIHAVERGERITICRHGKPVADLVPIEQRPAPMFGTLKGKTKVTPEQLREAMRPMTNEEAEAWLAGRS